MKSMIAVVALLAGLVFFPAGSYAAQQSGGQSGTFLNYDDGRTYTWELGPINQLTGRSILTVNGKSSAVVTAQIDGAHVSVTGSGTAFAGNKGDTVAGTIGGASGEVKINK